MKLSKKPPKVKKQTTIFELQRVKAEASQNVVIDLTREESNLGTEEGHGHAILCPVCSVEMSKWEMNIKITHVEECLSLIAADDFGPANFSSQRAISNKRNELDSKDRKSPEPEHNLTSEWNDTAKHSQLLDKSIVSSVTRNKREGDVNVLKDSVSSSKKTRLSGIQLEMKSFVNTKARENKTSRSSRKVEKVDPALGLLPSSRKKEIPDLKKLLFTKNNNDHHMIAVDAFCYKPHASVSQYFLSHFHSDHYGGFAKRWCRERTVDKKILYCSDVTAKLLMVRFNAEPEFIFPMRPDIRYKVWCYGNSDASALDSKNSRITGEENDTFQAPEKGYLQDGGAESLETTPGLYVTPIDANHCPGATIFLFESISNSGEFSYTLHCGDFRVSKNMLENPALQKFHVGEKGVLLRVYLDTTYMAPEYNFPLQETVCDAAATMIEKLAEKGELYQEWLGSSFQSRITDFLLLSPKTKKKKFLLLVGTYLIGKEKLAIALLKRMGSCPIYVSNINSRGDKREILNSFGNKYLDRVLTEDDIGSCSQEETVVHLVPMKIVGTPEAISSYFNHNKYFQHFEKCIGFRPTGWAVQNPHSRYAADRDKKDLSIDNLISILKNRPSYSYMDILGQKRPQTDKALDKPTFKIYSLPYSEHLSFRELSFFALWLNIEETIPTVNTENERSRLEMSALIEKWDSTRKARAEVIKGGSKDIYSLGSLSLSDM